MDRFEEMNTLVRVVEAGSLSRAAERLGIAKSAVSRRLADLEGRLGVQLLHRTTRRIQLTEIGRNYYQRAVRLLGELEETEQAVASEQLIPRGTIRLAAPLSFGNLHLSPALDAFLLRYPEVRLDLDLNDRTVNILEEGVDLAIRIGQLTDSTLVARRLAAVKIHLCASPGYLERYGEPQSPEELSGHIGLSYSNIPESQQWLFRYPDGRRESHLPTIRMRANNGDVLLRAAIDGLGIVSTPHFLSNGAIAAGRLRPLLTGFHFDEAAVFAVYPAQRFLPRRVRLLIDFLVDWFGQLPSWELPNETAE